MRLSVECAFPYLRKRGVVSRESALWVGALRKNAVCDSQIAQTALCRHIAVLEAWGATTRQAAGHYQKWLNWENAFEQPPARLRGGLLQDLQIWFWSLTSRKVAVWARSLDEQSERAAWMSSLGAQSG